MASSALSELQVAFLPAALGAVAVMYSNILGWGVLGKIRYAEKGKQVHPYKPWDDKSDQADAHFRGFKATQNAMEWTVLVTPVIFLYQLYCSAIPVVGAYLYWSAAVLGLAFGYLNVQYIKGYIKSADDRLPPFKMRANVLRIVFFGFLAGAASSALKQYGVLAA